MVIVLCCLYFFLFFLVFDLVLNMVDMWFNLISGQIWDSFLKGHFDMPVGKISP